MTTATLTRTQTVTLPLEVAIEAFAAVLPHASTDAVTPILCSVQLVPADDAVTLYATDRYTVGRFTVPLLTSDVDAMPATDHAEPFNIPTEAATWIAKTVTKTLRHANGAVAYAVVIEDDAEAKTVTVSLVPELTGKPERAQAFERVTGNFPPVSRLFPEDEGAMPDVIGLSPQMLSRVIGYATKYHRRAPIRFSGTAQRDTGSAKMSPILASIGGLTALIQPNLLLR